MTSDLVDGTAATAVSIIPECATTPAMLALQWLHKIKVKLHISCNTLSINYAKTDYIYKEKSKGDGNLFKKGNASEKEM